MKGSNEPLEIWVDADHGGCLDTRRSTTGWICRLYGCTINGSAKRQATVAVLTVEAEYIAVSEAAKEGLWLRGLLEELGYRQPTTRIWCDNQGAIVLSKKPGTHMRTKHISIRHHLIRELVEEGTMLIELKISLRT